MTTNINIKIVELEKFKKDKRQVFVDFTKNLVHWKDKTYRLKYIKVGNKHYPYVILEEVKPLSKIKEDIHKINNNKFALKRRAYKCDDMVYLVTGIGYNSIKVYKNNDIKESYLKYNTREGQYLLEVLVNYL